MIRTTVLATALVSALLAVNCKSAGTGGPGEPTAARGPSQAGVEGPKDKAPPTPSAAKINHTHSSQAPQEAPHQAEPVKEDPALAELTKGNNEFAARLYGKLAGRKGNLFVSPASISTALALAYAGARGTTADEMAKALSFTLPQDKLHSSFAALSALISKQEGNGPTIRIANQLWGDRSLRIEDDYQRLTKEHYGASLQLVDFRREPEPSRVRINAWVSEQTNDKIKDLLPPESIKPNTALVLTNAIYFKGKWAKPFDEKATKPLPFRVAPGKTVNVPMMQGTVRGKVGSTPDGEVIMAQLPYRAESDTRKFAMAVLVPTKVDGFANLERRVSEGKLYDDLKELADRDRDIRLTLPRFKLTWEDDLKNPLMTLGMTAAFNSTADFSGISAGRLQISRVQHKAFVSVNEEGTEAAAATGVGLVRVSSVEVLFPVDQPFLFVIRDVTTGAVLFIGRVLDPR